MNVINSGLVTEICSFPGVQKLWAWFTVEHIAGNMQTTCFMLTSKGYSVQTNLLLNKYSLISRKCWRVCVDVNVYLRMWVGIRRPDVRNMHEDNIETLILYAVSP